MKCKDGYEKLAQKLEETLKVQLFDQNFAIESITKTLVQMRLVSSKVRALFTFIGPPNCGKRYLAELLVTADPQIHQLKTFQMDQYNDTYSAEQLSASNIEEDVTEFVEKNPNAILLFEDIDKADTQVQLSLYTLFSDSEKNIVDFSHVIVIMTTTRLSSLLGRQDLLELFKNDPLQAHTFLMERLGQEEIVISGIKEKVFDKKLLSLLNECTLVPFNRLSLTALIKIGAQSLHGMSQNFIKDSGIEIEYTNIDVLISLLTLSLAPYLNARHIRKKLPEVVFNRIYDMLKCHENITKISYKVSQKAGAFVKEALKDQPLLLKKISKQHESIELEWHVRVLKGVAEFTIKNAFFRKEKLPITSEDALHVSDVTFDAIAGQQRVKAELLEILTLIKEPARLKQFDMPPPKGMILYGPSGMGKKLLARAFANAADMPFTVVRDADLFDAGKIHKAYAQAYSSAPAIVLLEDIDVQGLVGGVIATMSIQPLIDELDAINQSFDAPIFTIITIGESSPIPDPLVQTGRIDIRIEVPKLDMEARRFFIEEILKKPHDANIDIEKVVRYISGMGGDELKRIGQEAALFAARKGLKEITEEILLEQINIIKYGNKLENKQIRDIEISMAKTAYHEAGHAVLSYVLCPNIKIEQVTVAPRSDALGFVSYHNDDYVNAISKDELFANICVLLGGRIANMEKYGNAGMETGAITDLEIASMQAYSAIALFGMDEELGYINISGIEDAYDKELLAEKLETRLLSWIDEAKKQTEKEVKRLWPAIEAVALALIAKEVIDGLELKKIIEEKIPNLAK
ncbi:AAA family ATPase [Sulfurospirillum arsenophilum]|uniref:AAA family ATPase n=1 Tax=Sulfurospirillum arsenophilum TaxID=56698 RepID=UPI0005AB2CBC|nr:AAA family ATPase [Sulfurospirillum arsenophilum]